MATNARGIFAEKKVKEYLEWWQLQSVHREFNRLTDSKAAGRIIKAAAADFEYFCLDDRGNPVHGLIEVKETEHEYRIARDKVPQLPRLRKREKCGGASFVLVYHTALKCWRVANVNYLATTGDKGSWNLTDRGLFALLDHALFSLSPTVFERQNS